MFNNMTEVREANADLGRYFFSPDTMAFFNSVVETELIRGRYFITSEKGPHQKRPLFTIREVEPDGDVNTFGEFQEFTDLDEAREAVPAD